jgi:hypothetical protein
MMDERLTQFLKDGKDWERKATSIPGVFLLRLPAFRSRTSSVAIEINPVDSAGAATKKRGIVIRSRSEYDHHQLTSVTNRFIHARSLKGIKRAQRELAKTQAEYEMFKKYKTRTSISK